ncbi:hypothetical protein L0337_08130 [candidate division KSB1 bacterium]|nr:hypothetical protein [candidate division KSB1 bacterium]
MLKFTLKLLAFVFVTHNLVWGQESHSHKDASSHRGGLHFSHPLITESPSPDTKVRFDYFFREMDSEDEKARESTVRFEGEYAFHQAFSIEVNIPYVFQGPDGGSHESNLGNLELALKFANLAFAENGLLLGSGIEFGIPTGNDMKGIGSDHIVEIEPFLNLGYRLKQLEVVAFTTFGIPTNLKNGDEAATGLGYNISLLYHFTPRLQGLLEFDGEAALNGEEEPAVINITPGIKVSPLAESNLQVGLAVSLPLSSNTEFDTQALMSIFYHF